MKTAQFLLLCILGAALLSALYPGRIQKTGFILIYNSRSVCVDASASWTQRIMKRLDQSSF
uniref:Chemokine interleukin-8-like domain-containing protein n=1 Tax=Haplochromis burtoni TaxID=8153 RepID=A0A3Q3C9V1_HAPBU